MATQDAPRRLHEPEFPFPRVRALLVAEALPIVVACLMAAMLLYLLPVTLVQDGWLALVGGRHLLDDGLFGRETLTLIAHGRPWTNEPWLGQLALYGLAALGGVRGALVANVLLVVGAFTLAMALARHRGASPFNVAVVGLVAFVVAPWSWQMRTQSLALVLFVGLLWLLLDDDRWPARRVLWALPLLALWGNLHGSVAFGIGLTMLYGLVRLVRDLREGAHGELRVPVALLVVAPLTAFASPYAGDLPDYYRHILFNAAFREHVADWQRTTPSAATAAFFVVAALTLVLVVLARRKVTLVEGLLLAATFAGGVAALRGVVWFPFVVLAIAPRLLEAVRPVPPRPLAALGGVAALAVLASGGLLAVTAVRGQGAQGHFPTPAARAVGRVAHAHPGARLLVADRLADWLLWRQPELAGRLAYDSRIELLEGAEIGRLNRFWEQEGPHWKRAARAYRIVVVDREQNPAGVRAFLHEPGARRVYRDAEVDVVLRAPQSFASGA